MKFLAWYTVVVMSIGVIVDVGQLAMMPDAGMPEVINAVSFIPCILFAGVFIHQRRYIKG